MGGLVLLPRRYAREDLAAVAIALNNRPRKTPGWKTPTETLNEHLTIAPECWCCNDRLNRSWAPRSEWKITRHRRLHAGGEPGYTLKAA
jgi:hypothetical protein